MSQTAVVEQSRALIGMKSDLGKDRVMSYAAEGAVKFSRFVSVGTDKELQGKLPVAALDITSIKAKRGVALQEHSHENPQNGLDPQYLDKTPMSILTQGGVYVEVEEAVTVDDDVFVRYADGGGGTEKGIFRTDADTATAAALANARFLRDSETIDGKLVALLELL